MQQFKKQLDIAYKKTPLLKQGSRCQSEGLGKKLHHDNYLN